MLSVPNANLRPYAERSLVGGAILLYGPARMASVAKRREIAVACAPIATSES